MSSKRTKVMGIINVTPDSFYSGSRVSETELLDKVEEMIKNGVDVIDIGGESTRPGADPVPLEEEIRRTVNGSETCKEALRYPYFS